MKRVILFLATNLAVMLVLSVVLSVLGVNQFISANGLNIGILISTIFNPFLTKRGNLKN